MSEASEAAESLQNPLLERAMTIDMVRRGVGFAVVKLAEKEESRIAFRGTFCEDAARSKTNGWEEVSAYVGSTENLPLTIWLNLAQIGVVRRPDGSWRPDTYTVRTDENTDYSL